MIILTPEQADQVRGLTVKGHALAPVPLSDANYVLPESVLSDPAHAKHHELLQSLTTRDVDASEYLASKVADPDAGKESTLTPEEAQRLAACEYCPSWKVGEAVKV